MDVSIIIPCYRSRLTLADLVERLHREMPDDVRRFEIILVVDGSPDETYTVARGLERSHPDTVRAVLLRRNYGQHNALLAGLSRARYSVTVTMDDDLQHRPNELAKLLAPLQDPLTDVVYGVGVDEEHGLLRSLASRMVKSALATAGVPKARDVSAFRAFRTELRDGFVHVADSFASIDVLLSWTTTAIVPVPVRMDHRTVGRSAYRLTDLARHAMNMVTGYSAAPLKLVTWLGVLTSLLGLVLLVSVLFAFFSGKTQVAGFTTLASTMAILCGAIMLSLGILGEYLGRLHFRSMQRPTYMVRVDAPDSGPKAGIPGLELPSPFRHEDPDEVASALSKRHLDRSHHEASRDGSA